MRTSTPCYERFITATPAGVVWIAKVDGLHQAARITPLVLLLHRDVRCTCVYLQPPASSSVFLRIRCVTVLFFCQHVPTPRFVSLNIALFLVLPSPFPIFLFSNDLFLSCANPIYGRLVLHHAGPRTDLLLPALDIVDTLVKSAAVDMVVVDSVAALVPKAELEGEMGDHHIALQVWCHFRIYSWLLFFLLPRCLVGRHLSQLKFYFFLEIPV